MDNADRNRTADGERRLSISRLAVPVLAVVGIGITSYLTYTHYAGTEAICIAGASCDVVLTSEYSAVWGIPLSLFGTVMYLAILGLGLSLVLGKSDGEHLISLGIYGVAFSGIIFTGYLYYLEIFVLHAFCTWCIASSIVLALIFILSVINFVSTKKRLEQTPHTRRFKISDYVQW